ncbi:hypothetical protein CP967_23795 [Streptomyces nitrosporeus]|uniref:P68 RBP/TagC-like beta-propeller domain-containing protein n=1 Tax=Streptomyces nitrosporeus TaxID=28894 RepID=A0A5J6FI83_9ACTN|nr:hypothetical protein [Streptomyces nitrosporeus]QEU74610.1 hypothetical protein CP967_23795 [Streptomyces nitrosporeus]GGY84522.1 hypothetical protein GCM10010327_13520 [Streptomyces nitrosporeus]
MINLASPSHPALLSGAVLAHTGSYTQSLFWEPVEQLWYICQRRGTTGDQNRIQVSRLTADGALKDSMLIARAGHGANIGVERSAGAAYLWTDAMPNGDWASAIARIRYVPGGTADAGDPAATAVHTPRTGVYRVSATIDPTRRHLVYRWQSNNINSTEAVGGFDRYDLDAAAAGTFTPLETLPYTATGRSLQGYACLGDHLYTLHGEQGQANTLVTCANWASGEILQTEPLTTFGSLPHAEPEGICVFANSPGDPQATLAFGIAHYDTDNIRRINVARFPHPGTGPWVAVPYDETTYTANSANYVPQYRLAGDQVHLHFSMSRNDGKPWGNGEVLFQLPLRARPNRTQRLLGVVGGGGVDADTMAVRFEVTTDGNVIVYDERALTSWVGADAGFWRC